MYNVSSLIRLRELSTPTKIRVYQALVQSVWSDTLCIRNTDHASVLLRYKTPRRIQDEMPIHIKHFTFFLVTAHFVAGRSSQLWSSDNFKCTITCTSSHLVDPALAATGPSLWNSLPTHVCRLDLSLNTFYRKLKTYLTARGASA